MHLNAPFKYSNETVARIPTLYQTETFGVVGSDLSKSTEQKIQLHLMNDTLLITNMDDTHKSYKRKLNLMYAPIPLNMTSLEKELASAKNADCDLFTLKVSPLKMMVLKAANSDTASIFHEKFQKLRVQCLDNPASEISSAQSNRKMNTKVSIPRFPLTGVQDVKLQESASQTLFESWCQPWVFKEDADGAKAWIKVTKSRAVLECIQSKYFFTLKMDVTFRTVGSIQIFPSTLFQQQGPKKLSITLFDGQKHNPFLIIVQRADILVELLYQLRISVLNVCRDVYQASRDDLIVQKSPKLDLDSAKLYLKHTNLCEKSQCSIMHDMQRPIGPVNGLVLQYGNTGRELYQNSRFQIRSELVTNLIFLDIQVNSSAIAARVVQGGVIIRAYIDNHLDYKLEMDTKSADAFVEQLTKLIMEGDAIQERIVF